MDEHLAVNVPTTAGHRVPISLKTWAIRLLAIALFALFPLTVGDYLGGLITEVLIFSIFAMSLDLLIGYTGMISFGHSAFFGLGAYAVVTLGTHLDIHPLLGGLFGIAIAMVFATVAGYFCIRASGVYFIMLTLAFSQLLYSISLKWRAVTGGSDGITGPSAPSIAGVDLTTQNAMYFFVLLFFLLSFLGLRRLMRSSLGHVFVGIRENEARMRAIGFPTQRYKLLSFVVAGGLGALAGGLFAIYNGFVAPNIFFWVLSGEALIMVILGGMGTLIGPVIGAAMFLLMKNYVSAQTEHWELIIGGFFILCVLFFKQGVYGWLEHWWKARRPS